MLRSRLDNEDIESFEVRLGVVGNSTFARGTLRLSRSSDEMSRREYDLLLEPRARKPPDLSRGMAGCLLSSPEPARTDWTCCKLQRSSGLYASNACINSFAVVETWNHMRCESRVRRMTTAKACWRGART